MDNTRQINGLAPHQRIVRLSESIVYFVTFVTYCRVITIKVVQIFKMSKHINDLTF